MHQPAVYTDAKPKKIGWLWVKNWLKKAVWLATNSNLFTAFDIEHFAISGFIISAEDQSSCADFDRYTKVYVLMMMQNLTILTLRSFTTFCHLFAHKGIF